MSEKMWRLKRKVEGVRMKDVREQATVQRKIAEHGRIMEQLEVDKAVEAWRQGPDNHLDDLRADHLGGGGVA